MINYFTKNRSKGFTLIELLVVIAIIGILSTLLLLQLSTARGKARDAKRVADIGQIRTAIEMYFDDQGGKYPIAATQAALETALSAYFSSSKLPVDPLAGQSYFYAYANSTAPSKFHLWAELERSNAAAFSADSDLDSSAWVDVAGNSVNASTVANKEVCTETAVVTPATTGTADCIYDVGSK